MTLQFSRMRLIAACTISLLILPLVAFGDEPTPAAEAKPAAEVKQPVDDVKPAIKGANPRVVAKAAAVEKRKIDPFKLDESQPVEDQWRAYLDAAKKHYGFESAQVAAADFVLESCVKRAAQRRAERAKTQEGASDGGSTNGAGDAAATAGTTDAALKAALSKLTDEFIQRVDSIAKVSQVIEAEKQGFVSPRRPVAAASAEAGALAPDFSLLDADGNEFVLSKQEGKVVVLAFWASWCGWCKKTIPDVQKIHEQFADNDRVVVYGINCRERDTGNAKAKEYIAQEKLTYHQLFNGEKVMPLYQVQGFPAVLVIGPDGKILHKQRGYLANLADVVKPMIEGAIKAG